MKTSTVVSTTKRLQANQGITTSLLIAFVLLCFTTPSNLIAQDPGPGITVRFANPEYDFSEETYCVDVEFRAGSAGVELFGLNARFFVDYDLFDFLGFDDFQGGYGPADDGMGLITSTGDGNFFGFTGDALFINQAIEKVDASAQEIILSTTDWTYLFKACFIVKDEAYLGLDFFCPSIVWDLRQNENKGFPAGSDGLVMTVVSDENGGCILAAEEAMPFNWEYDDTLGANMYGVPITDPEQLDCITTKLIPLTSWALALVAMLMMVFVVVRKRLF